MRQLRSSRRKKDGDGEVEPSKRIKVNCLTESESSDCFLEVWQYQLLLRGGSAKKRGVVGVGHLREQDGGRNDRRSQHGNLVGIEANR